MARIGLIDVDGKGFPNIPLMKLSAWHKSKDDVVEWYDPMFSGHFDRVYLSKVFSFTNDYQYPINADMIIRGGTGYCINLKDGKEMFESCKNHNLPNEIEHIYPDYSIYPDLTKDTAFGFLTRGCPRGCDFCIVGKKEAQRSFKVADLNEFWNGQRKIVICDPNILACNDWRELLQQLINSGSEIDFNQGLDIRLMTEEKAEMLNNVRYKEIRFAWDRYQDKQLILSKLQLFLSLTKNNPNAHKKIVYTIVNYDTTIEQDLERIYILRDLGFWPYVMIYDKTHCKKVYKDMQRWVNNRFVFGKVKNFEDYQRNS